MAETGDWFNLDNVPRGDGFDAGLRIRTRLVDPDMPACRDAIRITGVTAGDADRLACFLRACDTIATHTDTYVLAAGGLFCSLSALRAALTLPAVTGAPVRIDAAMPDGVAVPDAAELLVDRPLMRAAAEGTALRTLAARQLLTDFCSDRGPFSTDAAAAVRRDPWTPPPLAALLGECMVTAADGGTSRNRRYRRRGLLARIAAVRYLNGPAANSRKPRRWRGATPSPRG